MATIPLSVGTQTYLRNCVAEDRNDGGAPAVPHLSLLLRTEYEGVTPSNIVRGVLQVTSHEATSMWWVVGHHSSAYTYCSDDSLHAVVAAGAAVHIPIFWPAGQASTTLELFAREDESTAGRVDGVPRLLLPLVLPAVPQVSVNEYTGVDLKPDLDIIEAHLHTSGQHIAGQLHTRVFHLQDMAAQGAELTMSPTSSIAASSRWKAPRLPLQRLRTCADAGAAVYDAATADILQSAQQWLENLHVASNFGSPRGMGAVPRCAVTPLVQRGFERLQAMTTVSMN